MAIHTVPNFPLIKGRAHEVCGPGAYFFAFTLAAKIKGQVLWIREHWQTDQINPTGVCDFFDPSSLIVSTTKDQTQVLAIAEDALRSGAVSLVVLEVSKPTDLTTGRRLQLAARDGKSTALTIIPQGMGSNAAETRWFCEPIFDPSDSTLQRWHIIKNKTGTLGAWHVKWDTASRRVYMVSPAGQRTGTTGAPD
jgi:protein ImuA